MMPDDSDELNLAFRKGSSVFNLSVAPLNQGYAPNRKQIGLKPVTVPESSGYKPPSKEWFSQQNSADREERGNKNPKLEIFLKVTLVLCWLVCFGLSMYGTYIGIINFMSNPSTTSESIQNDLNQDAPAITFCPQSPISCRRIYCLKTYIDNPIDFFPFSFCNYFKDDFEKIPNELKSSSTKIDVLNTLYQFVDCSNALRNWKLGINESELELMVKDGDLGEARNYWVYLDNIFKDLITHSIGEMVETFTIYFEGDSFTMDDFTYHRRGLSYQDYKCFTFNSKFDPRTARYSMTEFASGFQSKISFFLRSFDFDACNVVGLNGYSVYIHYPYYDSKIAEALYVGAGQLLHAELFTTKINTLEHPFKSGCIYGWEKIGFKPILEDGSPSQQYYTFSMCSDILAQHEHMVNGKCVCYDSDVNFQDQNGKQYFYKDYPLCVNVIGSKYAKEYDCFQYLSDATNGMIMDLCNQTCHFWTYKATPSSILYPSKNFINHRYDTEHYTVLDDFWYVGTSNSGIYEQEPKLTAVSVKFSTLSTIINQEVRQYPDIFALIGNIGGIWGVYIGLSIYATLEYIKDFILYLRDKYDNRKKSDEVHVLDNKGEEWRIIK